MVFFYFDELHAAFRFLFLRLVNRAGQFGFADPVYIGSPTASPYLRPRRASRVWGWVGEVVRIYYTYRLVGVCVCVCVWSGLCPTSDCPTWDSPDPTEPARVPLARALSRWCCCCGRRARACAPTRACALCRVAQAPGQKLVVADPLGLVMPARCRGGSR